MQAASCSAPAASASSTRRTFRTRNVVARPVALSTYSGMRRASIVDTLGSSKGRVSLTAAIARSSKGASSSAPRRFTVTAMFEVSQQDPNALPSSAATWCQKPCHHELKSRRGCLTLLIPVSAALHREGYQGGHACAGGGPSPRPQLRWHRAGVGTAASVPLSYVDAQTYRELTSKVLFERVQCLLFAI